MNHDDNLPNQPIDPELEARVVAWVLGEASPFEEAELTRRVAENPALAVFKRRIEAVHGLVGEAARPVSQPMMLSAERRAKLLAVIGGGEAGKNVPPQKSSVMALPLMGSKKKRRWRPWLWAAAACLPLAVIVKLATTRSYDTERRENIRQTETLSRRMAEDLPSKQAANEVVKLEAFEVVAKPSLASRIMQAFKPAPAPQNQEGVDAREMAQRQLEALARKRSTATRGASQAQELRKAEQATRARSDTTMQVQGVVDLASSPRASANQEARRQATAEVALAKARAVSMPAETKAKENQAATFVQPSALETTSTSGTLTLSGGSGYNGGGGGGAGKIGGAAGKANTGEVQLVAGQGNPTLNYTYDAYTGPRQGDGNTFSNQKRLSDLSAVQAATELSNGSLFAQSVNRDSASFNGGSTLNLGASAAGSLTFGAGAIALAEKKDSTTAGMALQDADRAGAKVSDGTVQLSPFEVSAGRDRGYFAASTISGARLNTKLEDLASSITVTTRQSMSDAASLSVNDNFLSETPALPPPAPAAPGPSGPAKIAAAEKIAAVEVDRPVIRPAPTSGIDESLRAEVATNAQSVSTFSLHVSDVSFRLAKAALDRGERPDPTAIRPEEFYNAFDYGDPAPATGEPVSCRVEQAAHPFLQQRNLVRIAMKVPATGRGAGQPLRLTVLLDTSGSMEREDRAAAVRKAMEVLASLLGPDDRVTLIGFARQPRLLADRVPGDQAAKLVEIIGHTPSEGGTNLEEALKLAGEHARAQFTAGAQNRIVVLTDGAANLGNDDPAQLSAQIVTLRQQGIAFDACGVGADGLDDTILEALTRKGDGRYYVINSPAEADARFAHELAGAFRPAAQNVKVQVRFNPARVRSYRLIGFEQHRLREEDFRNDQVDAAELAAEEAAVALYQVEVLPEGEGELGDVFVRFRNAASSEMVERSWTLAYAPQALAFDRATASMQLAGTAALLAEKLRGGTLAAQIRLADFAPVVNALHSHYANEARVQELVTMFAQTRRLTGE